MKKLILLLVLLFCWTSFSTAEDLEPWDYLKVKSWSYSLSLDVVILMHEEFIVARNYYFDENYKDREKITAFTVWHKVGGKFKPTMFVQVRVNLEPTNNDLGHEMKHIINYESRKKDGTNRFPLPCDDWK